MEITFPQIQYLAKTKFVIFMTDYFSNLGSEYNILKY